MDHRQTLLLAAASGFVAVALGAFGAHGLAQMLGERASVWTTAVHYQMFHTSVLLILGLMQHVGWGHSVWLRRSVLSFVVGILLFSGSLYVLALGDIRWLGMITPLGGVAFLAGWVLLAVAVARGGRP